MSSGQFSMFMKTVKADDLIVSSLANPLYVGLHNVQLEKLTHSPLLLYPECTRAFNIPIYTPFHPRKQLSFGASKSGSHTGFPSFGSFWKWTSSMGGGGGGGQCMAFKKTV